MRRTQPLNRRDRIESNGCRSWCCEASNRMKDETETAIDKKRKEARIQRKRRTDGKGDEEKAWERHWTQWAWEKSQNRWRKNAPFIHRIRSRGSKKLDKND